jgi:hypothetical protein
MATIQSDQLNKSSDTQPKVILSFSGHETFPFRYTWLKKAIDAVCKDPLIFQSVEVRLVLIPEYV